MNERVRRGFWRFSRWAFYGLLAVVSIFATIMLLTWGAEPGDGCRLAEYGFQ